MISLLIPSLESTDWTISWLKLGSLQPAILAGGSAGCPCLEASLCKQTLPNWLEIGGLGGLYRSALLDEFDFVRAFLPKGTF